MSVLLQQGQQEPSADNHRANHIEQHAFPAASRTGFHTHVGEHAAECLSAVRGGDPQLEDEE